MEDELAARLSDQLETDNEYTAVSEELSGKRAAAVATILDLLIEAEGQPIPTSFLLEESGSDVSQMGPAFLALELTGVAKRFTYDNGGKKPVTAYAIDEQVEVK